MNGVNELNKVYLDRIENVTSDKPSYIRGFANYMIDSSIKTKYGYVNHVISFVDWLNKDIEEVAFDDFNNYLNVIMYKDDGSKTTSSYQINVYSALKKFCEYLYASKRINDNYMLYIKRPKAKESQQTITKREKGFLTEKEIKKMMWKVECGKIGKERCQSEEWNVRDKAIILTFLCTGIRCSALRAIDVDDLDMTEKTLTVTDKGEKVRKYDMSESLYSALKEWIEHRDLIMIDQDSEALFVSHQRKRISAGAVTKIVKYYSDGICDGKNITPHKLRATYGTQLYNKTGDIYFVQECMGHTNPKTTEIYIREKKENTKRAGDIMDKLL